MSNSEDCGCGCGGGTPQDEKALKNRREFISTVLKTGAALTLAGMMVAGTSEKAYAFDFGQCMFDCGQQYERDLNTCRRKRSRAARALCYGAAELAAATCRAGCAAQQAAAWATGAAQWIADHPGVAIGTVVVVAGVVCIVVATGGGAVALAPAALAL